ncbi:MAG TPA: biotin/lipoyl-containing protein [Acidimicrobiales bacterium]|nr:biotin/lipoyl-containing protein [Acidimicrobiales bacterium]
MPDTLLATGAQPAGVTEPGEELTVLERVVVAPSLGVFTPHSPATATAEGELVEVGQAIGVVENSGCTTIVRSPFAGFLMGMLATAGERVREGEPVAWLRVVAA